MLNVKSSNDNSIKLFTCRSLYRTRLEVNESLSRCWAGMVFSCVYLGFIQSIQQKLGSCEMGWKAELIYTDTGKKLHQNYCDNEMLGNTVFMILYIQIVIALVLCPIVKSNVCVPTKTIFVKPYREWKVERVMHSFDFR